MSRNRVVLGLPERYEKAKKQIALFERRIATVEYLATQLGTPLGEHIVSILKGEHDDDLV